MSPPPVRRCTLSGLKTAKVGGYSWGSAVVRIPSTSQSRAVPSCEAVRRILLSTGSNSRCSIKARWPVKVVNSDARPTSQMRIGPFMEAVARR